MKYKHRYLENHILTIHKTFKVLYLGGPRQVGKTTLLLHLSKKLKMNYVTLDDLAVRKLAQDDPDLFLQEYSAPLFIDEIQYAPRLLSYIKIRVDRQEKMGQYWLTGSQYFSLMKNLQESLAGRVGIIHLLGFSLGEIYLRPKKKPFVPLSNKKISLSSRDIFDHIFRGSFPALWQNRSIPLETFYNSYLQTYIDRDLRDIFGVTKLSAFHTFIRLCAARTGQILNYSDLARDASISVHAAREWMSILESTLQVYLLQPYYSNISKRLIKAPKLYFLDTGLAAYLTKWKTAENLRSGAMAGAFFETFVIGELLKNYLFAGKEPPFFYFRDKEGHEIDILIQNNASLFPIEIKLGSFITEEDIKNISYLRSRVSNLGMGTVICLSPLRRLLNRTTQIIPVSDI